MIAEENPRLPPGEEEHVSDPKRRIAKTSEELMQDIEILRDLERQKRREPISTPRFHELAEDVTTKSREVMNTSLEEEALGDAAERGDETIDDLAGRPEIRGGRDASPASRR